MSKESNWSLFVQLRCRRFLMRFCLFLVLFFYFFVLVSFTSTTLDKFHFPRPVRLSQVNIKVPIRLKLKFYAIFIEWGGRIDFLFVVDKTSSTTGTSPPSFPETATKEWYRKLLDMNNENCWSKSLFAAGWLVLQILLEWLCLHSFLCYHYQTVFSEFVFPHSLQPFWIFSTTNIICNFWLSIFQQVSTQAFCSNNETIKQKNCGSPNYLCKLTESPPTLSTNTSRPGPLLVLKQPSRNVF